VHKEHCVHVLSQYVQTVDDQHFLVRSSVLCGCRACRNICVCNGVQGAVTEWCTAVIKVAEHFLLESLCIISRLPGYHSHDGDCNAKDVLELCLQHVLKVLTRRSCMYLHLPMYTLFCVYTAMDGAAACNTRHKAELVQCSAADRFDVPPAACLHLCA
jgi:hypothetical protein